MFKERSSFYVYILSNLKRSVFYIGVTNNLVRRMYEHKNGLFKGFSNKYRLYYLVYYEECSDINSAITREKQLKNWHRDWKINLIEKTNPKLEDLSSGILD